MEQQDQHALEQDERARWREFGAWLEVEMRRRYPSHVALAKQAGLAQNSVRDFLAGGRRLPDGSWRVPNPTDVTLGKLALALGLKVEGLYERVGGTYQQRNPDRYRLGVGATSAATVDRISRLEDRVQELEDFIRERLGDTPPAARPRRRRPPS